jgi:hypothetical protein
MCAGGPPKPVQPSRSHARAIVASDTLGGAFGELSSSTRPAEYGIWATELSGAYALRESASPATRRVEARSLHRTVRSVALSGPVWVGSDAQSSKRHSLLEPPGNVKHCVDVSYSVEQRDVPVIGTGRRQRDHRQVGDHLSGSRVEV